MIVITGDSEKLEFKVLKNLQRNSNISPTVILIIIFTVR